MNYEYLISALLLVAAVINLAPVAGARSAAALEELYGVRLQDPNLVILLRHRAVLFGLVGGLMLYAVFDPALRSVAYVFGYASMVTYLIIVKQQPSPNSNMNKIFMADVIGLICLSLALALELSTR